MSCAFNLCFIINNGLEGRAGRFYPPEERFVMYQPCGRGFRVREMCLNSRLARGLRPKFCQQNFGLPSGLLQAFEHFNRAFNVDLIFREDQCRTLEGGDRQLFQRAHLIGVRVSFRPDIIQQQTH